LLEELNRVHSLILPGGEYARSVPCRCNEERRGSAGDCSGVIDKKIRNGCQTTR
jgi:hypothetical protein